MNWKKKAPGFLLCILMLATVVPSNCWQMIADAMSYINSGEIIEFGSYPQSQVTDEADLTALNALLADDMWQSYGYYSGTGEVGTMTSSEYMKYADVDCGEEKYRAVLFSEYRPAYSFSSHSAENSHQDDNGYFINTVYWFKFEPLNWRVLDADTGLILCDSVIDAQPLTNTAYENAGKYYSDPEFTTYANSYVNSDLRAWLNNDFYNTAFSETEQGNTVTSEVDNYGVVEVFNDITTQDKVFIPSSNEMVNTAYGFISSTAGNDKLRMTKCTDYSKIQGSFGASAEQYPDYAGNPCWRLRTAGSYETARTNMDIGGDGGIYDDDYMYAYGSDIGIRPALRLNPQSMRETDVSAVKLEIATLPDKISYWYNETLDTTGLSLRVTYSNGDIRIVKSNFTCDKTTLTQLGNQDVTVTYAGKTVKYHIYVNLSAAAGTTPLTNSHRYVVYNYSVTWAKAKEMCEQLGGHLVTITDASEQATVASLAQSGSLERYWLGGTDEAAEGTWKWITGENWKYTNWASAQPDNAGDGEDWLELWTNSGNWNDEASGQNVSGDRGFICEFEPNYVPEKTIIRNGHMYSLYFTQKNWTDAKTACETLGGHLATITSPEEQAIIDELITYGVGICYWIGATDAETEGIWKWVTGEEFGYFNWETGEPNNIEKEDYAQLYAPYNGEGKHTGKWNDADSGYKCGFIYEKELDSVTPAASADFGCNYYELYDINMSWEDAQAYAESKGGHLVTITSASENTFLKSLIGRGGLSRYKIGASDKRVEGIWEWVTGEAFTYSNWNTGEPNNGQGSYIENHGEIYAVGAWNDYAQMKSMDVNIGFIIEYDGVNVNYDLNYDKISPNLMVAPTESDGWIKNADGTMGFSISGLDVIYNHEDEAFTFDTNGVEISYGGNPFWGFCLNRSIAENGYLTLSSILCEGAVLMEGSYPVLEVGKNNIFFTINPRCAIDINPNDRWNFYTDDGIISNMSGEKYLSGPLTYAQAKEAKYIGLRIYNIGRMNLSNYKLRLIVNSTNYHLSTVAYSPVGKRVAPLHSFGELITPVREGFTFEGWYTEPVGGEQITSETEMTQTTAQTIYAHWLANEYTVKFDSNGGNTVANKTVTFDTVYGELPIPVKNGYTFLGWYTKKIGGSAVESDDIVKITDTQTLYACWIDEGLYNKCGDKLTWSLTGNTVIISGAGEMYDYEEWESPWSILALYINNIQIEYGVTSIGAYAFCDGYAIESIELPSSVSEINEGAFQNCTAIRAFDIPINVSVVSKKVFNGCSGLTSLCFDANIIQIERAAFENCYNLESVTVMNPYCVMPLTGTNYPYDLVFCGFTGSTVESYAAIKNWNFESIGHFGEFDCVSWRYYVSNREIVFSGTGTIPDFAVGCTPWNEFAIDILTITLNEGISYIGSNAFSGCTSVTAVNASDNIQSIGKNALEDTAWFRLQGNGMVIFKSVLYAYKGVTPSANVVLNNGISVISSNFSSAAQNSANGLESIQISNSVQSIGDGALAYFSDMTSLSVNTGNKQYKAVGNILYNKDMTALICCPAGSDISNIKIPDSVTEVRAYAFAGCQSLTEIHIGRNVTSIGVKAFDGTALATIYGYYGSYAQSYAEENGYSFVPNTSTVTFDWNDDENITTKTVNTGCAIGELALPNKTGYNFEGWYLETEADEDLLISKEYIVNEDVIFYAYWDEIESSEPKITQISVQKLPTNMNYFVGDVLKLDGIEVYTVFDDGKIVMLKTGYTCVPTQLNTAGTQVIKVSYGSFTTSFDVTVTPVIPSSIRITTPPNVLTYFTDSIVNPNGINVKIEYNNGTTQLFKTAAPFEYTYDFSTVGSADVTVNYEENGIIVSTFYQVTVCKKPSLYSDELSATAGDTVAVPVYVRDNIGLMGLSIALTYDKNVFTPQYCLAGTVLNTGSIDSDIGYGIDGVTNVIWYGHTETTANGLLFTIYFSVNRTTASGVCDVSIDFSEEDTFNERYENILLSCTCATINIINSGVSTLISVDNVNCEAGDTVDVAIRATANTGIDDLTAFTLLYDHSAFTPTEITAGITSIARNNMGKTPGNLKIFVEELAGDDGILFTVRFAVSSEAIGSYIISISNDIGISCQSGTVVVAEKSKENATIKALNVTTIGSHVAQIPIFIENNHGLMGLKLNIIYDKNILTPIEVSSGDILSTGIIANNIDTAEGTLSVIWSHSQNNADDGILFTITFNINTTVSFVESSVAITYSTEDTFDENWNNVELDCEGFTVSVNRLEITALASSIYIGETTQLSARYALDGTQAENIIWTSGDTYIATVDENGLVTGKAMGNVVITAITSDGLYSATYGIQIKPTTSALSIFNYSGAYSQRVDWWRKYSTSTMRLGYHAYNCEAAARYVWSSSNSRVKIDQDGNITNTGAFSRSATITLTAYDADGNILAKDSVRVSFYKFNWQKSKLQAQSIVSDNVLRQNMSVRELEAGDEADSDSAADFFVSLTNYFLSLFQKTISVFLCLK